MTLPVNLQGAAQPTVPPSFDLGAGMLSQATSLNVDLNAALLSRSETPPDGSGIVTPTWRLAPPLFDFRDLSDTSDGDVSSDSDDRDADESEEESLADQVFARRHRPLELEEKELRLEEDGERHVIWAVCEGETCRKWRIVDHEIGEHEHYYCGGRQYLYSRSCVKLDDWLLKCVGEQVARKLADAVSGVVLFCSGLTPSIRPFASLPSVALKWCVKCMLVQLIPPLPLPMSAGYPQH